MAYLLSLLNHSMQRIDDSSLSPRMLINKELDFAHGIDFRAVIPGRLHGMAKRVNNILGG